MANTLIPIEERSLSPVEVEALDRRRRRGQLFLVISWQCIIIFHAGHALGGTRRYLFAGLGSPDGLLGRAHVRVSGILRACRHSPAPRLKRIYQLLRSEASAAIDAAEERSSGMYYFPAGCTPSRSINTALRLAWLASDSMYAVSPTACGPSPRMPVPTSPGR